MNEAKWKKWEQTRQGGHSRYIWIYGVLLWGVPTGVAWALFSSLINSVGPPFAIQLGVALIVFPMGGYFWGMITWKVFEKKYANWLEKSGNHI